MFSIKLMCFVVLLINPVKIEGQTLSKTILLYNVCLFSLHYLFNALLCIGVIFNLVINSLILCCTQ